MIANRTSDMFAFLAKDDGKVVSLNENGVIVEYKDGTQKGVLLGRNYGKAEGSVYPHDIVSMVKLGQTFKKGDPIAYNSGFFEPDFLNPKRILLKNSMTVKTVLLESNQTHEDASCISKELGERMRAKTTKIRTFNLEFSQNLVNVVKVGQEVNPKTLLMIIEDQITSTTDVFDQQSLEALKRLSNQAPKANYLGVVDKIEIRYHGDKRDMSSSLKLLADRSDKLMADNCKATGTPVITGRVNDDYRVEGTPLALDKAEVKIFITIDTPAGVGDKGIFASQMKSVIGEVMDYSVHAEDGTKIDAMFGYRSVAARIVESPLIMGTTISVLNKAGSIFVQIYRK